MGNDENEQEVIGDAFTPPHIIDDEAGGGFYYVVHLRSGAEARAYDPRNINQVRDDWIQRKSGKGGVITFQGTVDGSGEGSGLFAADEVLAIRYLNENDDEAKTYNLVIEAQQTPQEDEDDEEDEDEDEDEDDDTGEVEPSKSLADFKA